MNTPVTSCFRGIDTSIGYLRLSPRSTWLYQKQCEISYPTRMASGTAWVDHASVEAALDILDSKLLQY
ncbi:UNVERIFIED_CONTAM: hypothetical protein FKN15_044842 [Acipenser sinensis]